MSQTAQQEWNPFFRSWAHYAQQCLNGKPSGEGKDLPPLSESYYLDHLELVQRLYKAGKLTLSDDMYFSNCDFQGLVIAVSAKRETSKIVADYIAEQLGGAKQIDDVDQVNNSMIATACEKGKGYVCNAAVGDRFSGIRKLMKDFGDFVSIVLFQCSEADIKGLLLPENEEKVALSMMNGWRSTRCSRVIELPGTSLFDLSGINTDEGLSIRPSAAFTEMLLLLMKSPVLDERPGLLVFFPSIPGSGKSTCVTGMEKDVADALVGVGKESNRNVFVQVGDKTKEKFWRLVKRTRIKVHSCINIADKNAPPSAWGIVADICVATKALAVPVFPDASAIRTTRIVGVRKPDSTAIVEVVHVYPFSLQYLAVCIARVTERPAGSHAGRLDRSTERACLIVVKFFALYRAISAEDFLDMLMTKLTSAGALVTPAPIQIPFFESRRNKENFPADLKQVLAEALSAQVSKQKNVWRYACVRKACLLFFDILRCHPTQYGYDLEKADTTNLKDEYLDDLERRLRDCVEQYRHQILGLSADKAVTRQSFLSSLIEKIAEVQSIEKYEAPSLLKIASIDIDVNAVHKILSLLKVNTHLSPILEQNLSDLCIEEFIPCGIDRGTAEGHGFVTKTHVTLAHCRQMRQSELRSIFTPLLGAEVELSATGLLWNERVIALAVTVAEETKSGKALPLAQSSFVHITVWLAEDASAVEANSLPGLVLTHKAHRIDFESPISLRGVVSLWSL